MNERLIGFLIVSGVVALLVALVARRSYTKYVRERWPIIDGLTTNLDPTIRIRAMADSPTTFQAEYAHHLLYTYGGRQYELHLVHPVPHGRVVQLRVNPAMPSEAYFADDMTQQVTHVAKSSR